MSNFSIFDERHVSYLENIFTQHLHDCIEILWIEPCNHYDEYIKYGKGYDAYIVFDGTNNKANKGHIYFTAHPVASGKIEDWEIINLTGSNYLRKDFPFLKIDGGKGYEKEEEY